MFACDVCEPLHDYTRGRACVFLPLLLAILDSRQTVGASESRPLLLAIHSKAHDRMYKQVISILCMNIIYINIYICTYTHTLYTYKQRGVNAPLVRLHCSLASLPMDPADVHKWWPEEAEGQSGVSISHIYHAYIHARVEYIYVCIYMYICMYVCMYVYIYGERLKRLVERVYCECSHVHVCIYTYTYAH